MSERLTHASLHLSAAFVLSCVFPQRPLYGDVSVNSLHSGGEAFFSCLTGYQLQGPSVLTCRNASTPYWSGKEPHCLGKTVAEKNSLWECYWSDTQTKPVGTGPVSQLINQPINQSTDQSINLKSSSTDIIFSVCLICIDLFNNSFKVYGIKNWKWVSYSHFFF